MIFSVLCASATVAAAACPNQLANLITKQTQEIQFLLFLFFLLHLLFILFYI